MASRTSSTRGDSPSTKDRRSVGAPPEAHPRRYADLPGWSPRRVGSFRRALLAYFRGSERDLPWRRSRDPYAVLVSEYMLQQTRVDTVIPYFERWMRRFPTPAALAAADTEEVLGIWEGLGYYSRARNLQRAMREVVAVYGGRLPSRPDALEALPGIGPYTAGAVASIAFGVPAPAVDGNARRVLARLADDPEPTPEAQRRWAGALVDPGDPGAFNQGLMELGALLCTPRAPRCGACPVRDFCAARRAGTQEERPAPRARRPVPRLREAVVILVEEARGGARILVRRRPDRGLLAGMWEFPGDPVEGEEAPASIAHRLAGRLLAGVAPRRDLPSLAKVDPLEPVVHLFTHRHVTYLPFLFRLGGEGRSGEAHDPLRWVPWGGEEGLPFPAAQRTLWTRVTGALGSE